MTSEPTTMTAEPSPSQVPVPPPAPPAASVDDDSLGIDRAFVLQMAQLPFITIILVALSWASTQLWAAFFPASAEAPAPNYGPVIVLCLAMILAAFIDGWKFKVPNWLTLSTVLSGWLLGLLHDLSVPIDGGAGGLLESLALTALGFALLFPALFIGGMGQGDVKMQMGFGAWLGAFFGTGHAVIGSSGTWVLILGYVIGVLVGGVFGLVMIVLRRKFGENAQNFRDIVLDLQLMVTAGPQAAAARAYSRRSRWDRLPYGVPLCVGFLAALWYLTR